MKIFSNQDFIIERKSDMNQNAINDKLQVHL